MQKLVLMYWGTIILMYLSQVYYPAEPRFNGKQCGEFHYLRKSADIFMILVIIWISSFSFLRTAYNDSPLSSKRQKNICVTRHLATGAVF